MHRSQTRFVQPCKTPRLCDYGETHIWKILLRPSASTVTDLELLLSSDERDRAVRFRSRELRDDWTVAHGALRHILAGYTGADPRTLVFHLGPKGKPELEPSSTDITFNLSHTNGLALLAVARKRRVGIDAEAVRQEVDIEALSRRFFAQQEADGILELPKEKRTAAFFACWTRKESFIKALGVGLSLPLDHFQVSVRADEPARLVSVNWDEPGQWSLLDVGEPGVAATLAVEGTTPEVRRFDYSLSEF